MIAITFEQNNSFIVLVMLFCFHYSQSMFICQYGTTYLVNDM